jgi:hypothetical protein
VTDEELIRLADAYAVMMLDDPRPLPCGGRAVENGIREVLRRVRVAEHAHPEQENAAPADAGGITIPTTAT